MRGNVIKKLILLLFCMLGLTLLFAIGASAEREAVFYVGEAVYLTMETDAADCLTLPAPPETGRKAFIGWVLTEGTVETLYAPGAVFSGEGGRGGLTFRALTVSLETMSGAAVSTSAPFSLRFDAHVPAEELARLRTLVGAENLTVGLLTAPRNKLAGVGKNFNHTDGAEFITDHVVETPSYAVGKVVLFSARIGGIEPKGLLDRYAARGYITVRFASGESRTVYAPFDLKEHARSVHAVLAAAHEDRVATADAVHGVAVQYGGETAYSPYPEETLAVFAAFLDCVVHIQTPVDAAEVVRIGQNYSMDGIEFTEYRYYTSPYEIARAEVDDKQRVVVVTGVGEADFHKIATYYIGGSYSIYLLDKCAMTEEGFTVWQSIQTALG